MEMELNQQEPLPDVIRLDIGQLITEKFFNLDVDLKWEGDAHGSGVGGPRLEECTEWLHDLGFERVEWAQPSDYILYLALWRSRQRHGGMLDEFVLEFAGQDSLVISLFNYAAGRVL